jgi:hypothetical protein
MRINFVYCLIGHVILLSTDIACVVLNLAARDQRQMHQVNVLHVKVLA